MTNAGARALTLRPPPSGSEQDVMSDTALGVWLDRFDLHASQVLHIVGSQYSMYIVLDLLLHTVGWLSLALSRSVYLSICLSACL